MITRKLDKTSRVKPTIAFYSRKNRAMMYCESRLEAAAMLKLEFDKNILSYVTQPCSIVYLLNGKPRRYTPDILIKYQSGDFIFWEIKPYSKSCSDVFLEKFEVLQNHFLNEITHPLLLMTSNDINQGKNTANRSQLYPFLGEYQDDDISLRIIDEANDLATLTVENVETLATDFGQRPHYAWSMLAHQYFNYDSNRLLTRQSTLEIAA